MRNYMVLSRSCGAVTLYDGRKVGFKLRGEQGELVIVFSPFCTDEVAGIPLPRGLLIEARGPAPSLREAMYSFQSAVNGLLILFSLSANAFAGRAEAEIAYEVEPDEGRREYRQRWLSELSGHPRQTRRGDVGATIALFERMSGHADEKRFGRAISHYHEALANWFLGGEIVSCSHLFVATETIAPALLRRKCLEESKAEESVAREWGIDPSERGFRSRLQSEARLRLVFQGDSERYQKLKNASDGYEHGFMEFNHVRTLVSSEGDRRQFARYVRAAIIRLLDVPVAQESILLGPDYERPLGLMDVSREIEGWVVGENPALGALGREHPRLIWNAELVDAKAVEHGRIDVTITETMTVAVPGANMGFQQHGFAIYGERDESLANAFGLGAMRPREPDKAP